MTIEDSLAIKTIAMAQLSPDGKWVSYTLSQWDKENDRRVSHIYLVPASGGSARKLTNGEKGETAPQWSPGDKWIAYVANTEPKSWAAKSDVLVVPVEGGAPRNLTADSDESVGLAAAICSKIIACGCEFTPIRP